MRLDRMVNGVVVRDRRWWQIFWDRIDRGTAVPWYQGRCWVSPLYDAHQVALIPFHWPMGWLRAFWWGLRRGTGMSKESQIEHWKGELDREWWKGYHAGE